MASNFDRWEKDPFFSAAEEVQESTDRMESTYRTWIHARKDTSGAWNAVELRRDLQTALGTAKWQLEQFERAVRSSYTSSKAANDAKDRHRDFIIAIGSHLSKVESSLKEMAVSQGKPPLPWLRLDEGEHKELALFLSRPSSDFIDKISPKVHVKGQISENSGGTGKHSMPECTSSSHLVAWGQVEAKEDKLHGHRRTASAGADIGSWNIAVSDDALPHSLSNLKPDLPPRKIPSFSGFLNTMESSMSHLKWSKNGYRKLKISDCHEEVDTRLPRSQNLTKNINAVCERNKSCLDGCDDYEKQLYGWYGAIHRLLQRSQYHMQYSRPIQIIFSLIFLFCLIVLWALRAV
ncbi:Syntaxin t-SNARE family [Olea europaea subsp. europaea]|uniref:Syntaxin t-SNARE family n=2 Tax=Olea europaea subsp. europaea TaxID=158383 RepID=A0A8S0RA41_OLEEU|nr:Syntaxin t-SNARE family [Olea europaea subsp. europaea]